MLTATARFMVRPLCSYSQAAIVAFAPTHVAHVQSECWLESPLTGAPRGRQVGSDPDRIEDRERPGEQPQVEALAPRRGARQPAGAPSASRAEGARGVHGCDDHTRLQADACRRSAVA
jgi:hypothetical protein